LKEILDKRYLYQTASQQNAVTIGTTDSHGWQRKQMYQYDVLSRLTSSELITQGQSENFIQIRERFAFDPASNILPVTSTGENNASISNPQIKDNRVKHLEQSHQTVDFEYDDLGRVIQKRIQMKDQHAFGYIQQHLSNNHVLHQLSTRQIDLDWDEQNQLKASTSIKPDGCGGQEIIQTQYCYDPFGRRIAKQSQIYKKALITQQIKLKTKAIEKQDIQPNLESSNRLGSSINLSLGGMNSSQPSALSRSITQPTSKTLQTEQLTLIQKQAVWNVWDGNRILQDYNGLHVFTTVYEADSFVPLARLVWLEDKLTEATNDDLLPHVDTEKINQLKHIALQNIGELEGLGSLQIIPEVANDEQRPHSAYQIYWYQNDHLGTPRELTSHSGDIAWEAVYQAWGNTVAVEWRAVEAQPIELNAIEKSYLLQPHRFQGQIYDLETGLHYNRFRYYDPDAGRFVSHDPIGLLGGENQFQYAPNPVEWVDLLGWARLNPTIIKALDTQLQKIGINGKSSGIYVFPSKLNNRKLKSSGLPKGTVRDYVGQAVDLRTRLMQHLRSGKLKTNDIPNISIGTCQEKDLNISEALIMSRKGGRDNLANLARPPNTGSLSTLDTSAMYRR